MRLKLWCMPVLWEQLTGIMILQCCRIIFVTVRQRDDKTGLCSCLVYSLDALNCLCVLQAVESPRLNKLHKLEYKEGQGFLPIQRPLNWTRLNLGQCLKRICQALYILLIVISKKCKSLAYKTTAQLPAVTTVKALRGWSFFFNRPIFTTSSRWRR